MPIIPMLEALVQKFDLVVAAAGAEAQRWSGDRRCQLAYLKAKNDLEFAELERKALVDTTRLLHACRPHEVKDILARNGLDHLI